MNINQKINPQIIAAVVGMLQPYVPELTPSSLIKALEGYQGDKLNEVNKPLTRAEAAALLSVSLNTVNRYLNEGKLRRIQLTARNVRIDYGSVKNLLGNSATRN